MLHFSKLHGAGNDFVIVTGWPEVLAQDAAFIRRLGDRHRGIGFDQLLWVRPTGHAAPAWAYAIYNQDGSLARQCGNGARCVVAWLQRKTGLQLPALIQSPAGPVRALHLDDGQLAVELGVPVLGPPLQWSWQGQAVTLYPVDMGNPHAVLTVPDVRCAPVAELGAALNRDPQWPQGVNVEFVHVQADGGLAARVYERGVGETLACGSGACAAASVALALGWTRTAQVAVDMPGGRLIVQRAGADAPVILGGPVAWVYEGEWMMETGNP